MDYGYNWTGNFDYFEGYGYFNLQLLEAMLRRGEKIHPVTKGQIDQWDTQLFAAAGIDVTAPIVNLFTIASPKFYDDPYRLLEKFSGRLTTFTMYESTQLPEHWPVLLEQNCAKVIVPSVFCKTIFTQQIRAIKGNVPIYLVPGGIDPKKFYPQQTQVDRPFTFMCLADRGNRKGWDLVWRALYDEFGTSNDVRLIVKCRPHNLKEFRNYLSDPRVSFWRKDIVNMAEVYRAADCFVFPSRGEGFGLPPREAAACGIPTIATNGTGLADNIEKWAIPISSTYVKAHKDWLVGGGEWTEPNYDELRAKMRWVYENRKEAKEFALGAAKWLHENLTWDLAADKMVEVMAL